MSGKRYEFTETHLEFCKSDKQRTVCQMRIDGKTNVEIAEHLGIHKSNVEDAVNRIKKHATKMGYSPEHGLVTPQSLPVSGTSTLYKNYYDKETGELVGVEEILQWVKTKKEHSEFMELIKEMCDGLIDDIPKVKISDLLVEQTSSSVHLLNQHTLTDFHLGMLAWADETRGENWDLDIAEEFLMRWMRKAIALSPIARIGLLMNLGDLLHFDGLIPETPRGKNPLETDSRFAKLVRVAIRCLRKIIALMLAKYPEVIVVMAPGNHDQASSLILREALFALYEDEPRITIEDNASLYGCIEHGNAMIAYHHGHMKGVNGIAEITAATFPEAFGRCEHRYVHLGHFHHLNIKESPLMDVIQHPTMIPKDAHAANSGYSSKRRASIITYHDKYGEVGSITMTPDMVRGN